MQPNEGQEQRNRIREAYAKQKHKTKVRKKNKDKEKQIPQPKQKKQKGADHQKEKEELEIFIKQQNENLTTLHKYNTGGKKRGRPKKNIEIKEEEYQNFETKIKDPPTTEKNKWRFTSCNLNKRTEQPPLWIHQNEVILMQEGRNFINREFQYAMFSPDRQLIIWSKHKIIQIVNKNSIQVALILFHQTTMAFVNVHIRQEGTNQDMEKLNNISNITSKIQDVYPNIGIICGGDFNMNKPRIGNLKEITDDQPTRSRKECKATNIDHVFSNINLSSWKIGINSDHASIVCEGKREEIPQSRGANLTHFNTHKALKVTQHKYKEGIIKMSPIEGVWDRMTIKQLKKWVKAEENIQITREEFNKQINERYDNHIKEIKEADSQSIMFDLLRKFFGNKKGEIINSTYRNGDPCFTKEEQIQAQIELLEDAMNCKLEKFTPDFKLTSKTTRRIEKAMWHAITDIPFNYRKAPGPDGIHPIAIQIVKEKIKDPEEARSLKGLTKSLIEMRKDLMNTRVTMIKKGNSQDNNIKIRPIQIQNTFTKIIEKGIMNLDYNVSKLEDQLTFKHKDKQHAFMKGKTTWGGIRELLGSKIDYRSQEVIFIDIKSAYNSVDRTKLMEKILNEEKMILEYKEYIMQWLKNTAIDIMGETYQPTKGLPQGSSLSPILFNYVFDDVIEELLQNCNIAKIIVFADDIAIIMNKTVSEQHIEQILEEFQFHINWDKTYKFAKPKKKNTTGKAKVVNSFKYLGINITSNFKQFSNKDVWNKIIKENMRIDHRIRTKDSWLIWEKYERETKAAIRYLTNGYVADPILNARAFKKQLRLPKGLPINTILQIIRIEKKFNNEPEGNRLIKTLLVKIARQHGSKENAKAILHPQTNKYRTNIIGIINEIHNNLWKIQGKTQNYDVTNIIKELMEIIQQIKEGKWTFDEYLNKNIAKVDRMSQLYELTIKELQMEREKEDRKKNPITEKINQCNLLELKYQIKKERFGRKLPNLLKKAYELDNLNNKEQAEYLEKVLKGIIQMNSESKSEASENSDWWEKLRKEGLSIHGNKEDTIYPQEEEEDDEDNHSINKWRE